MRHRDAEYHKDPAVGRPRDAVFIKDPLEEEEGSQEGALTTEKSLATTSWRSHESSIAKRSDSLDSLSTTLPGKRSKGDIFAAMTRVQNPEWLEMIFAATGISELQHGIEMERQKRAEDGYNNPFPEIYILVDSMNFEIGVAVVIVFNCISIGFEASVEDGTADDLFSVLEHLFVAFFFIEWTLRVLAYGWVWIFEVPNFCDSALVFGTGVLQKWVLEPLGVESTTLKIFTVLRALRLVRLARAVRLQPSFKELWILIHGLTTSARPLLWTVVIALMILYVFAVAATELIGRDKDFNDDSDISIQAQAQFGDLTKSLFTMFQLMTLDTYFENVVRPLMSVQPLLGLFFVFFVMLGVFVFWNLITAIIVDNAFQIAKEDQARQAADAELDKRRELKTLAELFLEIDKDGSGELSREEFAASLSNPKVLQLIDLIEMKPDDLQDTWDILDDGDDVLTIKEFTNGIRRMKGNAKAKDIIDAVKRLRITVHRYNDVNREFENLHRTINHLEADIKRISVDSSEILGLFHEMFFRLCAFIEESERKDKRERQKWQVAQSLKKFSAAVEKKRKEEDDDELEEVEEIDSDSELE